MISDIKYMKNIICIHGYFRANYNLTEQADQNGLGPPPPKILGI